MHVFGLPVDDQTEAISNGPECLAALSKALEFCTAKVIIDGLADLDGSNRPRQIGCIFTVMFFTHMRISALDRYLFNTCHAF